MDLHQFTLGSDSCGDTELSCEECPAGQEIVASSYGVLGRAKQLPNPVTLSALLAAATRHDAEVHPRHG